MFEPKSLRRPVSEGSICTIHMLVRMDYADGQPIKEPNLSRYRKHPLANASHAQQLKPQYRKFSVQCDKRMSVGDVAMLMDTTCMKTSHKNLLLSLPIQDYNRAVNFSIGKCPSTVKQEKKTSWFKRHILQRHSIGSNQKPVISETEAQAGGNFTYPVRRSVSMTCDLGSKRKSNDIFIESSDGDILKAFSLIPRLLSAQDAGPIKHVGPTSTKLRRVKKVALGLNLKAMHWPRRKNSHLPPPNSVCKTDILNAPLTKPELTFNHLFKVNIDVS